MKLSEALTILKPNIIAHLDIYRVGREEQSPILPQALWTSPQELAALRAVLDWAALKPTDTAGSCVNHVLRARITKSGLCRFRQGVNEGDVFPIKSITPGAGAGYWCAHVTDTAGNVVSLGEGDWKPVGGLED